MDITQLILDDHAEQRRLFAILDEIDKSDTAALGAVWSRLASFLEVHADTEEHTFYPALLNAGKRGDADEVKAETLDAIKDHNEIRDAVVEANKHTVGDEAWLKAVKAANKANSDHMAEEEREGLTEFRRLASVDERHTLAIQFMTLESQHIATGVAPVDKSPHGWVREHGG